jgi:uncharacterized membrane protein
VRSPRDGADARRFAFLLAIVAAAAFALRLSQLHQGLFGDELFTYSWTAGAHPHVGNSDNPPLFFVLAWLAGRLGDPAVTIRLPSLLLGTATVPVIYALGARTVGARAGLIGAAVFALAPFAIFYGVDARPYGTMVFFAAVSTLALVRAAETRSRRWWALYAIASAAAAYSHFSVIFVLAVQACWSLWACRDRIGQPLVANLVAALLYVPWLSHLHGHQEIDIIAILAPLSVSSVVSDLRTVFLGGYPNASLREIPTIPLFALLAGCELLAAVALLRPASRPRREAPARSRPLGLLALLALATPVGLLLYSLLVVDIFGSRQLLASLPAFALVLGAGLAALPRAATALVLAILLAATIVSFQPAHRRPDLPGVASFIEARAGQGAAVVYVPIFGGQGPLAHDLRIYLNPRLPISLLPSSRRYAQLWRSRGQLFVVAPLVGKLLFAPGPPRTPARRVTARRKFEGILTWEVIVYAPPA